MDIFEPGCASCENIFPLLDSRGVATYDCRFRNITLNGMILPLLEPCDHYKVWTPRDPSVIRKYHGLSGFRFRKGMRRTREFVNRNPLVALRSACLARVLSNADLFRRDNGREPSVTKIRRRVVNKMHHDPNFVLYIAVHLEQYGVYVFD